MSRLICDFYRRWWWVLCVEAALEVRLGWSVAKSPTLPFEFWAFMLALWPSAFLLSLDLRRGVVRTLAALPLTGRGIGRAWWLATVPLPATAVVALLFCGAGACCHLHPTLAFPAYRLGMAGLFSLLWLGLGFTMILPAGGPYLWGWNAVKSVCVAGLGTVTLFGSMLFLQNMSNEPIRAYTFLAAGTLLTVIGWARAERFDQSRTWPYTVRAEIAAIRPRSFERALTPLEPKTWPSRRQGPVGYGGVPFLLCAMGGRIFLYIAAMNILMALLLARQGQGLTKSLAIAMYAQMGASMSLGFIIVFLLVPVLRQLRLLRTLPVSTPRLAAVIIATITWPLIALGGLSAGVAWVTLGGTAGLMLLKAYIFILAPASLCILAAAWMGEGMATYGLLLLIFFGSQQVQLRVQSFFHYFPQLPLGPSAATAAVCLLLAFLFTWVALLRGSGPYRIQASPFGGFPFTTLN